MKISNSIYDFACLQFENNEFLKNIILGKDVQQLMEYNIYQKRKSVGLLLFLEFRIKLLIETIIKSLLINVKTATAKK